MYIIPLYSIYTSEKSEGHNIGYSYSNPCLGSNMVSVYQSKVLSESIFFQFLTLTAFVHTTCFFQCSVYAEIFVILGIFFNSPFLVFGPFSRLFLAVSRIFLQLV